MHLFNTLNDPGNALHVSVRKKRLEKECVCQQLCAANALNIKD